MEGDKCHNLNVCVLCMYIGLVLLCQVTCEDETCTSAQDVSIGVANLYKLEWYWAARVLKATTTSIPL